MSCKLENLEIYNFRCLKSLNVRMDNINVLFGPNGAGKSSFLDTIWFIRDCAIRGVDLASSVRDHGIGLLWEGADHTSGISIKLDIGTSFYEVLFGYSHGRIEPFAGEKLYSKKLGIDLIDRKIGSNKFRFYDDASEQFEIRQVSEPEKLALTVYSFLYAEQAGAYEADQFLHLIRLYHSRYMDLPRIKKFGSESDFQTRLTDRGRNLWSVLRNLKDKREIDERYNTIIRYMKESFPNGLREILIEQIGPNAVYGSFIGRHQNPIRASGVSDGHIQMLILLTALFAEGKDICPTIMFDEPEISLHPYALSVFAKAVRFAAEEWNRQIFIATHSPVLISQFEPEDILAVELDDKTGRTLMKRVSEMDDIRDLLEEYAVGSLYMAELIAAQSRPGETK